jgi:MFS family permease
MQQWSAAGQLVGPPIVAWIASRTGGWHFTWIATGACALAGLVITLVISQSLGRRESPASAGVP